MEFTYQNEFANNKMLCGYLTAMQCDQDVRDRRHYVETALEALSQPGTQAVMLNKLFKELTKVESIDFGLIPDSKGDITKYKYYYQLCDMMDLLRKYMEGETTENFQTMEKLHNLMLSLKPDFTFGFRIDNFMITSTYNLMVRSLYDLIDICISDVTKHLRKSLQMGMTKTDRSQHRMVTTAVNSFIRACENGDWANMMRAIRSSGGNIVTTESFSHYTDSHVDIAEEGVFDNLGSKISNAAKFVATATGKNSDSGFFGSVNRGAAAVGNVPNVASNLANDAGIMNGNKISGKAVLTRIKSLPIHIKVLGVIGIVVALLFTLRALIYLYYTTAGKLSAKIREHAEILREAVAVENDKNLNAIQKKKKLLNWLEDLADKIDYRVFKMEKVATKEITDSNKTDYSPSEIQKVDEFTFDF